MRTVGVVSDVTNADISLRNRPYNPALGLSAYGVRMTRFVGVAAGAFVLSAALAANTAQTAQTQSPAGAGTPARKPPVAVAHPTTTSPDAGAALVKQYCVVCHNEAGAKRAGGLSLASFDPAQVDQQAEVAEKMIRKLRAGMMPPPGARRPDADALKDFVVALENRVDVAAALNSNPGHRTFQRLNRIEYARSIRELLDFDVDVNAFLPPDTMSAGFDNIADVQAVSPTLLEGYLRAAAKISALALGDRSASPTEATYKVPRTQSQMHHIEGTPWGTRGGISVVHTFPADGDYTFRIMLHGTPVGELFGSVASRNEQLEISINGERAALIDIDYHMSEKDKNGLNLTTPRIHVKAGPQHLAAAFIQKFDGVVDDLVAPIDYTLADTEYGDNVGITILPHVRDFSITGPYAVTGVSDTPSRRRVFVCRPLSAADEIPCARKIVTDLATEAYRHPATNEDVESLMQFYADGRKGHDFEAGIKAALQALLASPHFLFRLEEIPAGVRPGQNYRITDVDLASRLSYFVWGTVPDAELQKLAAAGTLHTQAILDKQVRRMLADPRGEALSTRFASQWLRLQDVDKIHPDALLYPSFDNELAESYKRETELFFDSIVREDRNLLDLFTADYTFVNERIAKVYGIPNIIGGNFQRVPLTDPKRRGILGQGSVLLQTAVADRTSPVQRGKWIMEVLLGSPPPPPPQDPAPPPLEETSSVSAGGKTLTVRERMEEHRKNPQCASCHRVIDPLGLALENFDVVGAWRIKDNGAPVDTNGTLYDGTTISGPEDLRQALLSRSETVIRTFTDNLMSYGIGRRIEYYDQPTIRAIVKKAAANGNRFSSFVLGIVNSAAFQMAQAEPALTTAER
jgi:mono/diheme cytochrome c family protein